MINLSGVNFENHGAVMMLMTAIAQVSARLPDARFCARAGMDYGHRSQYGLYQRFELPRRYSRFSDAIHLVPQSFLGRFGIVSRRDVTAWLDISGFAFGDFWGGEKAKSRLWPMLDAKNSRGTPVVLLPQAYGPFEDASLRDAFKRVCDEADAIYVRDAKSLEYLTRTFGSNDRFIICPDFTIDLAPEELPEHSALAHRAIIVPNAMVVAGADSHRRQMYVSALVAAGRTLQAAGHRPFVLLHDAEQDSHIATELVDALEGRCEIVTEGRPRVAKAIIGSASLLVSSRFHALVSGLSQGVPSVGIGWSHKYAELMSEYGVESHLIDLDDKAAGRIASVLTELAEPANSKRMSTALAVRADAMREQLHSMWNNVASIVAAGNAAGGN